jgi:hypothetical protein
VSVTIITSAWNYFQKIAREDFTTKMIHALSMTQLINDFNPDDKTRLMWLRDYTHKDVMQSVYELDRYVNPSKGKYFNQRFTFKNGRTFTQDDLQRYLCLAIEEATMIIYRNFKDFKTETKLDLDSYDNEHDKSDGWDA